MKHYVTFGQQHAHRINGITLDCECVAVYECDSPEEGRDKAFEAFGPKFCFEYSEKDWNPDDLRFYRRGYKFIQI